MLRMYYFFTLLSMLFFFLSLFLAILISSYLFESGPADTLLVSFLISLASETTLSFGSGRITGFATMFGLVIRFLFRIWATSSDYYISLCLKYSSSRLFLSLAVFCCDMFCRSPRRYITIMLTAPA